MVSNFLNLAIIVEKNGENSTNSRLNVNNKKVAKVLGSKIGKKNVIRNEFLKKS
jgi:hypothetical protein